MDYVPQHGDKTNLADRDQISGVRTLDGEDQGKYILSLGAQLLAREERIQIVFFIGYGNRLRMQQLQQADWIA
jgi:hypothetical protein